MSAHDLFKRELTRRQVLRTCLCGLGVSAAMPAFFGKAARALAAEAADNDRILVVLELSGGNDGLNTLAPYGDDAYYRHRPTIGIKRERLRKIDQHFGFSAGMAGFERLFKDGRLAIVHGCGYDNPSFSHFTFDTTPAGGSGKGGFTTLAPTLGNGFEGITQNGFIPSEPTVGAGPLTRLGRGACGARPGRRRPGPPGTGTGRGAALRPAVVIAAGVIR